MKTYLTLLTIGLLGLSTLAQAADKPKAAYPLTTCFISGEKLGEMGKPVVFTYEGREIELCCGSCKKKFDKDPESYIQAYDAAVKAAAK